MPLEWPGSRRMRAQQHYERALQYYQQGKTLMAIADLSEAIEANRRRADLYSARAFLWVEEDKPGYAESDCESALRLNSRETLAHYVLGMVAYADERYDDAIRHFTQALECSPNRVEFYYFRSVCHYENDALEQAEVDMHFARNHMAEDDARQLDAARWLGVYARERKGSSR